MPMFLSHCSNVTVKLQKNDTACTFFLPRLYCKCNDELCNFTKAIRAAEELGKGAAETFLNGCEGDGRNGGEGLQSTHVWRGRRTVILAKFVL